MAGTFSQLYVQVVFAVKGRENLIKKEFRTEIFEYIAGIIKGKNQKPIIVNGVGDHVHLFVGLRPSMSISDLVRDVKNNSSNFINSKKYVAGRFSWQEGYAAFSYSQSQIDSVFNYIQNQESHHQRRTFREEYLDMLVKFQVQYDEKYLFDWIE
ncbi:REP element-mobilizing transposase RayT [Dyadobacter koreensis]|uniref:REP element-mobilizing transposase RayT n=1 Tax=Dyadobacter koreensis TaxID=408657 RepID=A0A1H7A298_9BACT|nr:IS200/IS605 family transposase [Dyadobacter koreensis]SEJ58027.1 REP element-mobilizing transposase RayT [Dyadobacter koreensis]